MQRYSGHHTGLLTLDGGTFNIQVCADSQGVIDAGYRRRSRKWFLQTRTNPVTSLKLPTDMFQKPAIKLTLGLKHWAIQNAEELTEGDDGKEDLGAELMWTHMKCDPTDKWA
ncbi:hypothetical protein [Phaffia rhodozyma]|uniref:Uncharacterized protein n=1 Tax=Phaffia rhodozyma TaxID=264483 RepID=A0A0F7SJR3_PHARH|nr:hypothetical protein [Phaffia rhodozyma]CDZ97604.1 hypothetical protein [Phaffia rhodozyma]